MNLAMSAPAIGESSTGQYSDRMSMRASGPMTFHATYTVKAPAETAAAMAATFLQGDSLGGSTKACSGMSCSNGMSCRDTLWTSSSEYILHLRLGPEEAPAEVPSEPDVRTYQAEDQYQR